MAGLAGALVSAPFDVSKSRVMNQPIDAQGRGLTYSGLVDCMAKTVYTEGVTALWKVYQPVVGSVAGISR